MFWNTVAGEKMFFALFLDSFLASFSQKESLMEK